MNLVLRGGVALLATFIVSLYLGIQPASADKDLRIHDIQGADQTSSFIGEQASVSDVPGVVTVVLDNGFYMQDPLPDDDAATSEGIFVFTNATPITTEREPLGIGDAMRVAVESSSLRQREPIRIISRRHRLMRQEMRAQ